MQKIIVFGPSIFGEIVYHYLKEEKEYQIVGFSANKERISEKKFLGLPVIPFETIENEFPPEEYKMFIAIGYQKMNKPREKIFNEAKKKGYELISYISPKATIWNDTKIGENCFIFENNVIQPFVKIGNNVVLWSGNHIGHGVQIFDHCYISSHVVIAGFAKIQKNCFLGINSSIRDEVTIGRECVIGAGSIILNDTNEKEVYSSGTTKKLSITSDKIKKI